jgi:hypothetical protein
MSRRFIPPSVEALGDGPGGDAARALTAARDAGFAEGCELGLREGHAAGFQAGEAAAQQVCQAAMAELRAEFARRDSGMRVAESLRELLAARDEDQRTLEATARAALAAALGTVFPTLLGLVAGREIAALLADTLAERTTDTLTLRAHPATIAAVQAEGLAAVDAERLTMVPDPTCAPGVAGLAWSGGGMHFDPAALLDRVTAILRPCPATSENLLA